MGQFTCLNTECSKQFNSRHSVAKYCSRSCAAKINIRTNVYILEGAKRQKYSDEFLIECIQQWHSKEGKVPSHREFDSDASTPNSNTYADRFGSWNNAVVLAGLQPHVKYYSKYYNNDRNLVTPKLRFSILKRDSFKCAYCGGTPDLGYVLHVDHIDPVANGGTTVESNLITACNLCNSGKSDQPR